VEEEKVTTQETFCDFCGQLVKSNTKVFVDVQKLGSGQSSLNQSGYDRDIHWDACSKCINILTTIVKGKELPTWGSYGPKLDVFNTDRKLRVKETP
jgi:hypothetical protein